MRHLRPRPAPRLHRADEHVVASENSSPLLHPRSVRALLISYFLLTQQRRRLLRPPHQIALRLLPLAKPDLRRHPRRHLRTGRGQLERHHNNNAAAQGVRAAVHVDEHADRCPRQAANRGERRRQRPAGQPRADARQPARLQPFGAREADGGVELGRRGAARHGREHAPRLMAL